MDKKLSRLIESNMQLYFLVLVLFAVAALFLDLWLGVFEAAATVMLFVYFQRGNKKREQAVQRFISDIETGMDSANRTTMLNAPFPMMVFRPDTAEILWSNDSFLRLTGMKESLFETRVQDVAPQFSLQWLLEGKTECPEPVEAAGRHFRVYGSLTRAGGRGKTVQSLLATTYWMDTTEQDMLHSLYTASRPVTLILMIDNYEELVKASSETGRAAVLAQVDEKINAWVEHRGGMLLKYDRDRYLYVCDTDTYEQMLKEKFPVLDAVREVVTVDGVAATLSIGAGIGVETFEELFHHASLAIEMALSRGGDQVVVRNHLDFEFYGGKAKATEKRTKVKSRVMANALGELISDAGQIFVMGHKLADMDALGAAVGICCLARRRGKAAQIVIDEEKNACGALLAKLREHEEYRNVFTSGNDAFISAQPGALLVVVDTNRPEMVESEPLLDACNRVAVIDHHRRAASYIESAALNFHEPYASSASELVTELLQHLIEPSDLLRDEAEALLAGIVLDTKNFTMRTGGRTFEAAAFLRRAGADTTDVQRFFQSGLDDMLRRHEILRNAEMYRENIAVAVSETGVARPVAAKAADELLTLRDVAASFVIFPVGEDVNISARSLGDINVQRVMEMLSGGGNSTTAGGQLENTTLAAAREQLLAAIDRYFEE
ncbi:MAG: DHH family phosphoesterase [Oscillospiraceae bacterium]|nr:DHH family phosphoesterase [Oscillospiraceae bacterium]